MAWSWLISLPFCLTRSMRRSSRMRRTSVWSSGATGRKVAVTERDACRSGCVDAVVLPAAAPAEFTHPCSGGGGDVDDGFASADQPLGQVMAQSGGVFDRPDPIRPLCRPCPQLGVVVK